MKKKVAVVVLVALVLLVTTVSADAPAVTSWWNNYTSDNSTTFTISYTDNRTVFFNATANQSIDYWVWYVDGVSYQNSSADNITKMWTDSGDKTVSVYGINNTNGQTDTLTWNIEIQKSIYEQNLFLIMENQMIGTTILFTFFGVLGFVFFLLGLLRVAEEYFMDIILIFASGIVFLLLGYQCYISDALLEFAFASLLLIVMSVIIFIFGVIRIIDVAINEFSWGEDETTRDENYQYK